MVFSIHKTGNTFTSNAQQAFTLYKEKRFGEKKGKLISYMPHEVKFLLDTKKAKCASTKILSSKKSHDEYEVYSDFRKKGYIPKAGLKFGASLRIYKKEEAHAQWIVQVLRQSEKIKMEELTAASRVAKAAAKKTLIAIIDSQGDKTYIELSHLKP